MHLALLDVRDEFLVRSQVPKVELLLLSLLPWADSRLVPIYRLVVVPERRRRLVLSITSLKSRLNHMICVQSSRKYVVRRVLNNLELKVERVRLSHLTLLHIRSVEVLLSLGGEGTHLILLGDLMARGDQLIPQVLDPRSRP